MLIQVELPRTMTLSELEIAARALGCSLVLDLVPLRSDEEPALTKTEAMRQWAEENNIPVVDIPVVEPDPSDARRMVPEPGDEASKPHHPTLDELYARLSPEQRARVEERTIELFAEELQRADVVDVLVKHGHSREDAERMVREAPNDPAPHGPYAEKCGYPGCSFCDPE
jgi:hypothetical protein